VCGQEYRQDKQEQFERGAVSVRVFPQPYQSSLVRGNPLSPWKGLDRRV
jgi:hypothetical protein